MREIRGFKDEKATYMTWRSQGSGRSAVLITYDINNKAMLVRPIAATLPTVVKEKGLYQITQNGLCGLDAEEPVKQG